MQGVRLLTTVAVVLTVAVAVAAVAAAPTTAVAPATDDDAVPTAAIAIDCTTAVLELKTIDVVKKKRSLSNKNDWPVEINAKVR